MDMLRTFLQQSVDHESSESDLVFCCCFCFGVLKQYLEKKPATPLRTCWLWYTGGDEDGMFIALPVINASRAVWTGRRPCLPSAEGGHSAHVCDRSPNRKMASAGGLTSWQRTELAVDEGTGSYWWDCASVAAAVPGMSWTCEGRKACGITCNGR